MRDLDDAALERRLREVLEEHLRALPLDLTVDALDRRRGALGGARRLGRGPGITLFAAAALLLVGGALAAGSGLLRRSAVVSPVPAASLSAVVAQSLEAPSPSPSELARPSASPIRVAGPGSWIATGSMITPRYDNIAVRLADGRVLVAGGNANPRDSLTSVELYEPSTGSWSATGSMITPGAGPAILLPDGRVFAGDELYDPTSGTWTATGLPSGGGILSSATLLRDGQVLVVGSSRARLYDAGGGTWTATGKMVTPRYGHTATLLPDGRVLVAGGVDVRDKWTKSAELYDPQTNSWSATTDLPGPGASGLATLLQDGTVLFLERGRHEMAELYDPATETWTATGDMARQDTAYYTLTPLLDGTVLAADGRGDRSQLAEVYDPSTRSWSKTGSMLSDPWGNLLFGQPATPLSDGTVLVAGGMTCTPNSPTGCPTGATGFAELYVPAGVTTPDLGPFPSPTPTPTPTPVPTPYPPTAGPVPQGARPWVVTVVNRSSKDAPLFLAREPLNDMGQLCGSVTPDVVPAGVTQKVTFLLPPKSVNDCWLMIRPGPGAYGALGPTDNWPTPGKLIISDGGDNANGDDLSTVWQGP